MSTTRKPKVPWFGSEKTEPVIQTVREWRLKTYGTLNDWHKEHDVCTKCRGRGRYHYSPGTRFEHWEPCPACDGTGLYDDAHAITIGEDRLPTITRLTYVLRGRRGGLRPSKPVGYNGAIRFIWRIARFHSGQDVTMPVMGYFDLAEWARANRPHAQVSSIINAEGRELLDACEALADEVVESFGLSKFGSARAWRDLI